MKFHSGVESLNDVLANEVMVKKVLTIRPKNRVALARLRMLRYGVGALPVIDKNGILKGIITLRDIDLAGHEAYALLVEDLMTSQMITVSANTSVSEIAEIMLRTGIQRLPVVDNNDKMIGLVTQTVVIRAMNERFKQDETD